MSLLVLYALIAAGFLFLFGIFFLLGIKNKNRKLIYGSLISFIAFVIVAIIGTFTFLKDLFGNSFSTKEDPNKTYQALFAKAPDSCVKIIDAMIPVIPRMDTRTAIKFSTCPNEMRVLLKQYPYKASYQKTPDEFEKNDRFDVSALGDSCWLYYYEFEPGAVWRNLWMSKDSTKVIIEQLDD